MAKIHLIACSPIDGHYWWLVGLAAPHLGGIAGLWLYIFFIDSSILFPRHVKIYQFFCSPPSILDQSPNNSSSIHADSKNNTSKSLRSQIPSSIIVSHVESSFTGSSVSGKKSRRKRDRKKAKLSAKKFSSSDSETNISCLFSHMVSSKSRQGPSISTNSTSRSTR